MTSFDKNLYHVSQRKQINKIINKLRVGANIEILLVKLEKYSDKNQTMGDVLRQNCDFTHEKYNFLDFFIADMC